VKPCDEYPRQGILYSLEEARAVIGPWQNSYHRVWPRSLPGYRALAPVTYLDPSCRLRLAATMKSPLDRVGAENEVGRSSACADDFSASNGIDAR